MGVAQVAGLLLVCAVLPASAQEIEALLAKPAAKAIGEPVREREALAHFYAERGGKPAWQEPLAWIGPLRLRSALARELLTAVQQSEQHGLRPTAYHAEAIARALDAAEPATPEARAALDVLLSDAFVHLARHLSAGAVDPRALHPGFERAGEAPPDPTQVLAGALASGTVGDALAQLAPPHPEYAALVRALDRLRADPASAARADQVRANLERWRWLPRDLGDRHVRVNTPSFSLAAYENGEPALTMRVVVGEVDWKTPLAQGAISQLVLNPDWRVPHSVATREMLPAAQRDSDYFEQEGIEIWEGKPTESPRVDPEQVDWDDVDPEKFPYQLREPPGPHNPLGKVKFSFANPYRVYLHGTPADHSFSRALRALSHGCVRVEDEIALAEFALAPDRSWTRERLLEKLKTAADERLPLSEPLPVYLLYFTASAAADGTASYSEDPYGRDRDLLAALQGRITTGMPTGRALGEEVDVVVGERDASLGPVEVAGLAVPALAFAVQAELTAELRVAGRRITARVRRGDALIGILGKTRLGACQLGIGDRGIIDRDEAVEAALARRAADVVAALGCAQIPFLALGSRGRGPECRTHLHHDPIHAERSELPLALGHLDRDDSSAARLGRWRCRRRGWRARVRQQCGDAEPQSEPRRVHGATHTGTFFRVMRRILAFGSVIAIAAHALESARVPTLRPVVGREESAVVGPGQTLLDVAYQRRLGYRQVELINPGVDPWIPAPGTVVRLPTRYILPHTDEEGLVVNIPEMRMYDYTVKYGPDVFALAIGDESDPSILGEFKVGAKRENPVWNVPDVDPGRQARAPRHGATGARQSARQPLDHGRPDVVRHSRHERALVDRARGHARLPAPVRRRDPAPVRPRARGNTSADRLPDEQMG